jgi:lipoic acid synthetase
MPEKNHRANRSAKPQWLKKRLPSGPEFERVRAALRNSDLHTVCQEAKCPNIWECFSSRTATFLIMGPNCTRSCRFCAVGHGPFGPPDPEEAVRVANAAKQMGLAYVVVTSVTRDDLPDGGARFFANTIQEIRKALPQTRIEVLIPDFQGDMSALQTVVRARPHVLNHNLETVARLYPLVRPEAVYERSLDLLRAAHAYNPAIPTKSGLMLGLGETAEEVRKALRDLLDARCRMLTLGQYLQPSREHLPVAQFIAPEDFEEWKETALIMGFEEVASGPFVRSSYHAGELYDAVKWESLPDKPSGGCRS